MTLSHFTHLCETIAFLQSLFVSARSSGFQPACDGIKTLNNKIFKCCEIKRDCNAVFVIMVSQVFDSGL